MPLVGQECPGNSSSSSLLHRYHTSFYLRSVNRSLDVLPRDTALCVLALLLSAFFSAFGISLCIMLFLDRLVPAQQEVIG